MKKVNNMIHDIAIIGGGVSGSTVAINLLKSGISTLLLEKRKSLVNGPPFCHLHAGGNLYPDISIEQCIELLHQSIDMAKLYPYSIDVRPTFISIPKSESYNPDDIIRKLDTLVVEYKNLVNKDENNKVLGEPENYYTIFSKEDMDLLKGRESISQPNTPQEWMIEVSKIVDYNQLKFPVFLVNEYGWNLFRLASQASLQLEEERNCKLSLETEVQDIVDCCGVNEEYNWKITTNKGTFYSKYLLNAAGFCTGKFDNSLGIKEERLVEFKAAYVSKWNHENHNLPELIFHGKRGTPHGMAQLTPYADGYFQIHGMTEDITLFKNGLSESSKSDSQPCVEHDLYMKIENGWSVDDTKDRTSNAIKYISKFIPSFKNAEVGGPPLFGAQQIPGKDVNLRVAEISFPKKFYARSEIVKASSALDVAIELMNDLISLKIIEDSNCTVNCINKETFNISINEDEIQEKAKQLAIERGYPEELGLLYRHSINKAK